MSATTLSPVLYIPHGGGPLPLLGEPSHRALAEFLEGIGKRLPRPEAILVVSAHWETEVPALTSGATPELIYDYYGFPEESYHIQYPAPGAPTLAQSIQTLLRDAGFDAQSAPQRGFDHGLFVPLKLMYPDADIPCLQLSLLHDLNPERHIRLGRALTALREQGVVILGSGMSFHNMQAFYDRADSPQGHDAAVFEQWLVDTCCEEGLDWEQRESRLAHWQQAPGARYCHPREEHLLPLHVCLGAACAQGKPAQLVFRDQVLGKSVVSLLWD